MLNFMRHESMRSIDVIQSNHLYYKIKTHEKNIDRYRKQDEFKLQVVSSHSHDNEQRFCRSMSEDQEYTLDYLQL